MSSTYEILEEIRELRALIARQALQHETTILQISDKLNEISHKVEHLNIKMSVVWSAGGGALALIGAWVAKTITG